MKQISRFRADIGMLRTGYKRCDIQICFKSQEYRIQPEEVADPVLITSPPKTEIHTQPY